jgi:hypothetical protein
MVACSSEDQGRFIFCHIAFIIGGPVFRDEVHHMPSPDSDTNLGTTVVLPGRGIVQLAEKQVVGDRRLEALASPGCEVEEKPNTKKKNGDKVPQRQIERTRRGAPRTRTVGTSGKTCENRIVVEFILV